MTITVSRIIQYPLKGFDGVLSKYTASISESGCIGQDRHRWFELESDRNIVINGKWAIRTKMLRFFRIRTSFDSSLNSVTFSLASSDSDQFTVEERTFTFFTTDLICDWMSRVLEEKVVLNSDHQVGKPDDLELPSFTLLSEASAVEIGKWFGWSADEVIARLRPNILIDGVETFEEYRFLGHDLDFGGFRVHAAQACTRCTVPSVDPKTGIATPNFTKRFGKLMAPQIKKWAYKTYQRESHGFYATLNTKAVHIPRDSEIIVGQRITLK